MPRIKFAENGRFYAIDNSCPHRGGPLGDGQLDDALVTSRPEPG
jgi:nitrite reductase/ring-hydroxylating ferredoxin subunit